MKKVMVIFGTRPEAIKMAPVVKQLKKEKSIKTLVCSTGQHREMLKQVLDIFKLKVDYDLDLMKPNQDLYDITVNSAAKLKEVFAKHKPDYLFVQGDTTTAFVASLAAYYSKIKVCHVEAGLRSNNIYSPYPEEANRRFISVVTHLHFPPTDDSKQNLIAEGTAKEKVFVTGNTVIDALLEVKKLLAEKKEVAKIIKSFTQVLPVDFFDRKFVLLTMHRREKFGSALKSVLETIKDLAQKNKDINFLYPVHLNPNVQGPVYKILQGFDNVFLIPPQNYLNFIFLMSKCYFILTDSGGIQEECFVFGKPVIVMRDVTERNEAIKAGYAFLTGHDEKKIKSSFNKINKNLLNGFEYFNVKNPYGDGKASEKIVKALMRDIKK